MKKIYEDFFHIPEGGKIREKVLTARITLSIVVMLVCMFSMGITAYAFFSYTITSGFSIIKAANFDLEVKVSEVAPEGTEEVLLTEDADGYYNLENKVETESVDSDEEAELSVVSEEPQDKVYTFELKKSGTASVGFAKIEILTDVNMDEDGTYKDKQVYYTAPIGTYLENGQSVINNEYLFHIRVPADKSVKVKIIDNWGTCARGPILKEGVTFTPDFVDAQYMHISFDDVEYCLTNLVKNKDTYASIYDEPFFAWLRTLHDTYGAKFSLYTYTSVLDKYTEAMSSDAEKFAVFKAEFAEAKEWLKIGLHAEEKNSDFSQYTYEQGKTAWNKFVKKVVQITGTTESIDRMPRLSEFSGTEDALRGMRDAECGALGFLVTDKNETIYNELHMNDYYVDETNGLVFIATDMRFDEFDEDAINAESADSLYSYIIFGHEWQFYNENGFIEDEDHTGETWKTWVEEACKFAIDHDIRFNYPQTRTFEVKESEDPETENSEDELSEVLDEEETEEGTETPSEESDMTTDTMTDEPSNDDIPDTLQEDDLNSPSTEMEEKPI